MIKSFLINTVILAITVFWAYAWFTKFLDYKQEQRDKIIIDAKLALLDNKKDESPINAGSNIVDNFPEEIQEPQEIIESEEKIVENTEIEIEPIPEIQIVEKKDIPPTHDSFVDFHPQSPFWTWWPVFWETCEEASALIAVNYFRNIKMTATTFRNELLDIVEWQKERFWKFDHTDVEETAIILKEYFWYDNFLILNDPTEIQMKEYLSEWNMIIAPFYGVGMNPYYSDGGPPYHFMAIKWYTENTFITHDVGTSRWENYEYPISVIMDRLHDYHPTDIQLWAKKLIVVKY